MVFRNKQPLRSAFLELLTLVSLLFLIYTLVILFASLAFIYSTAKTRRYYQTFLLLLGLSVVSGLLTIYSQELPLLAAISAFALLSAFMFNVSCSSSSFVNCRLGQVFISSIGFEFADLVLQVLQET